MSDFFEIDVSGLPQQSLSDQPIPQLIWVGIDDLVVDRRYQREVTGPGKSAIRRIATHFDWTKYSPILLAAIEGGRFAVVDGQHRAHAAKLCGIESLPAMVVPMSLRQQANAFAAVNADRVRVHALSIYRAALAAGEDWALRCKDAVERGGARLATFAPTATAKKAGVVYALGLVRRMIDNGEGEAVSVGLAAIGKSQQVDDISAWSGPVLSVWFAALAQNAQFLKLDLAAIFDSIDFISLLDVCRARARQMNKSARGLAIEHVVQQLRDAR